MIQSIKELNEDYKKKNGELYTFKGDYIKILKYLHKNYSINSIGFNFDYSPYAKKETNKLLIFVIIMILLFTMKKICYFMIY